MARLEESIEIRAPIEDVWEIWTDFTRRPDLTENVVEVRRTGPERTHWVVEVPLGHTIEWDERVTVREPNRRICWEATGRYVSHRGCYRFESTPTGTRLTDEVEYDLPLSPVSDVVARFLGEPDKSIAADLRHFKEVMESGRLRA
jgi:uncharacterized membrane protein